MPLFRPRDAPRLVYLASARNGIPNPTTRVAIPVLAVTGEQDAPPMRREAVSATLSVLCDDFAVASFTDSGHYPMQETPPLLVSTIERFLSASASPRSD